MPPQNKIKEAARACDVAIDVAISLGWACVPLHEQNDSSTKRKCIGGPRAAKILSKVKEELFALRRNVTRMQVWHRRGDAAAVEDTQRAQVRMYPARLSTLLVL